MLTARGVGAAITLKVSCAYGGWCNERRSRQAQCLCFKYVSSSSMYHPTSLHSALSRYLMMSTCLLFAMAYYYNLAAVVS